MVATHTTGVRIPQATLDPFGFRRPLWSSVARCKGVSLVVTLTSIAGHLYAGRPGRAFLDLGTERGRKVAGRALGELTL